MTKYEFYGTPSNIRPFATLIVDDDNYDEEIQWIAEILCCKHYEIIPLPSPG